VVLRDAMALSNSLELSLPFFKELFNAAIALNSLPSVVVAMLGPFVNSLFAVTAVFIASFDY
jgi:hypothetical protein